MVWTRLTDSSLTEAALTEYQTLAERCDTDAIEFENQVLSIGSEFLPKFARSVRDGYKNAATSEYYGWLTDQLEEANGK